MPSLLLVDDKIDLAHDLGSQIEATLGRKGIVKYWIPPKGSTNPRSDFMAELDADTLLVVTDYDLTTAQTGLFGPSVVAWGQQAAIPVADYSRQNVGDLPREPDFFEIRVPREDAVDPAHFISSVFQGFEAIGKALVDSPDFLDERSPAAVLAKVLGKPELEPDLSLYALRLAPASGALTTFLFDNPPSTDKAAILRYVVGHLLLNSVLRYPGPIVSSSGLRAYLATDDAAKPEIAELFKDARYQGPFAALDSYYWLNHVDDLLGRMLPEPTETETSGEANRKAIEAKLGHTVAQHACPRCGGTNGGFFCPFTTRTVCVLPTCSVGSNSWIPQGARVCRIERDFFDEWSPILGL